MFQRALPLALIHVTFTLLCFIGGLVTHQHTVWSLLSDLVLTHVCTGFLVCIHMSQRDDDVLSDEKLMNTRPFVIGLLVTSIFALAAAGLVGTIVITCNPSVTSTAFVVDDAFANDVRDEWRYRKPTIALFLSLTSFVLAGHVIAIIWSSVLVHRSNVVMKNSRL